MYLLTNCAACAAPLAHDHRIAVKRFLLIFRLVTEDALKQREVIVALHRALSHQLDWSLDDLELDFIDRQVVDLVLADLPRLAGAGF